MSSTPRQGQHGVELDDLSSSKHIMAPDRGSPFRGPSTGSIDSHAGSEHPRTNQDDGSDSDFEPDHSLIQHDHAQKFLAEQAEQGQNFTLRGVIVGLAIGVIICFSNTYFGLQTGWISAMTMPAALIGFGFFKAVARCISYPFTPVENVLVQTVAGALGTMPLGCGFVGVMPALEFLLKPEENGPLRLSMGTLIVWSLGICFFGVVFAVPLRKEVIIREKLKFPSGTATALMIGVLHGDSDGKGRSESHDGLEIFRQRSLDLRQSSSMDGIPSGAESGNLQAAPADPNDLVQDSDQDRRSDWKANIRLLVVAFGGSSIYVRLRFL